MLAFLYRFIQGCRHPLKNSLPAMVSGVEVVAIIVIKGTMRGLEHPRRGVVQKEPLG